MHPDPPLSPRIWGSLSPTRMGRGVRVSQRIPLMAPCVLCHRRQPLQAGLDHPVAHDGAGEGEPAGLPTRARAVDPHAPLAEPQAPPQVRAAPLPRRLVPRPPLHPRGPPDRGGPPGAVPARGIRPPLPAALPAPAARGSHPAAHPQHRDHHDAPRHAPPAAQEQAEAPRDAAAGVAQAHPSPARLHRPAPQQVARVPAGAPRGRGAHPQVSGCPGGAGPGGAKKQPGA